MSLLRILLIVLGIIGTVLWYSDYKRFHDPNRAMDQVYAASPPSSKPPRRVTGMRRGTGQDQSVNQTTSGTNANAQDEKSASSLRDAQLLIERGEPMAAIAILEEILKGNPGDTQAMMELAMIYILDLKDIDKGKQLLEQIVRFDDSNRAALNELVNIYSDPARIDGGLAYLRNQMDYAIDASELHYAYGRLLAQSGRADEALIHFEQTKGLKDIQDQVALDAAQAAAQAGNLDKALENYGNAFRLQEDELNRAKEQGSDSASFIEERIFSTKMDWARTLIRAGRVAQARSMIDGIYGHEDDPNIVSIRNEISNMGVPM